MITIKIIHKPERKVYINYPDGSSRIILCDDPDRTDERFLGYVEECIRVNQPDQEIHIKLSEKEKGQIAHAIDWDAPVDSNLLSSNRRGVVLLDDKYVGEIIRGQDTRFSFRGKEFILQ